MSVGIKVPLYTIDNGLLTIELVSTGDHARDSEIFKSLIDDRLDILSGHQTFYFNGKLVNNFDFSQYSTDKPLQLIPDLERSATRFWVNYPEGRVKLSLPAQTIDNRDFIAKFILQFDESTRIRYRKASKRLLFNGQELAQGKYASNYPKDTEFTLEITEGDPSMEETMELEVCGVGNGLKLLAKPYETVAEFRARIDEVAPTPQRIIFQGQLLTDERTLADYKIKNGDRIFSTYKPRYAEEDTSVRRIKLSDSDPEWRVINPGVSWLGICQNHTCAAYESEVIINQGYGVFVLGEIKRQGECPICKTVAKDIGKCWLYGAKYRFSGTLETGEERKGEGEVKWGSYEPFLDGAEVDWSWFIIEVRPN